MSWVPPHGDAPVPAPPTQPPAAPPPAAPVVTPTSTAPVAARDTLTRTAILVAVVGSIVAGSLIGGIGTGLSFANRPPQPTYEPDPYDPYEEPFGDTSNLTHGDAGEATAVVPLVCDGACFDETSVEAAILEDRVFDQLASFDQSIDVWGIASHQTTARAAHEDEWATWDDAALTPDTCFPTWSSDPVIEPRASPPDDDFVASLSDHYVEDGFDELTQSVRLFSDTATASSYMERLAASIDDCSDYGDEDGYEVGHVTREPTLHPGDSVAAVGFVDSGDGTRYYVFDLQRGNMVIRSVAYSEGAIDDTRFRQIMMKQAALLEELEPVG